jgi:hypothetical protein
MGKNIILEVVMTNLSQVLQESAPAQSVHNKSYVSMLREKWGPMLEGISGEHKLNTMAVLFENQANHLMGLTEDTRSTNVGEFLKFVFPVLRRVWPNLIANEIVSVQPMTAPIGGVFFFDLKYGTTKGKVTAGDVLIRDFNYNYSSETIDEELVVTVGGVASPGPFSSTLDFVPIRPSSVTITAPSGGGTLTVTDDGSGNLIGDIAAGTNTIDYTTGQINGLTFNANVDANADIVVEYQYNMEANSAIPQINIDIELQEVRAKTRKLKALWSSEAADDLKAFHGIDAESEIVAGVAAEIALELDREIINDLYNAATVYPRTFDYGTIPPGSDEIHHIRSIITVLTSASNAIHKDSLRGPANFLVTGPDVGAILEQLETHGDFRPITAAPNEDTRAPVEQPHTFGVYRFGTLASKYICYKDPYFQVTNPGSGSGSGDILMGYKGSTFIDAGYCWSPYIPLQITATFLDPADFVMRKGLRTRYATKLLRSEFYRRVRVIGL